jgi:3-dehydroquinate synthase
MRRVAGENGGDLKELVRWIADETVLGVGLDRRTLQRAETTWMSIKQRIAVSSSEGPASGYEVLVGPGIFGSIGTILSKFCPAQRYAVVTDDRVAELYAVRLSRMLHAAGYRADVFAFTAGEARKTRETWALVCDAMMEAGLGRDSAVVAFGGGVPGDLGGFVAATYMRGLPLVQLPPRCWR